MQRIAFKMQLHPGQEAEYKKRHDELWPELQQALTEAGITDYSIFWDAETNTLFAYHCASDDFDAEAIPRLPIVQKWWAYMTDIMATNPDNSPVSQPLVEVFHLN